MSTPFTFDVGWPPSLRLFLLAFLLLEKLKFVFGNEEDVNDVQDADRLDEQEQNKPNFFFPLGCGPQRQPFPGNAPELNQ
jgi:hypothetical protein